MWGSQDYQGSQKFPRGRDRKIYVCVRVCVYLAHRFLYTRFKKKYFISNTLFETYETIVLVIKFIENVEDIDYSLAQFGMRPGDYAEAVGWTGDDVWHAHCVKLDSTEILMLVSVLNGFNVLVSFLTINRQSEPNFVFA